MNTMLKGTYPISYCAIYAERAQDEAKIDVSVPLARRLDSVELKTPRIFVNDEGMRLLLQIDDNKKHVDLSWFSLNSHVVKIVERRKNAPNKLQNQSNHSLDVLEGLVSELEQCEIAEKSLLGMNIVDILRASMNGSKGDFKPNQYSLHKVFYAIAQEDEKNGICVSISAFDLLRTTARYWPPCSNIMRIHWLWVLTDDDAHKMAEKQQSTFDKVHVLVDRLLLKLFNHWLPALTSNPSSKTVHLLTFLVELFELDLACCSVFNSDLCSNPGPLTLRPLSSLISVGMHTSSDAFSSNEMDRLACIARIMVSTDHQVGKSPSNARFLCRRLLAVCFEARRLQQAGSVEVKEITEVPFDLRRNAQELASRLFVDHGICDPESIYFPTPWLCVVVREQIRQELATTCDF